MTSTRNRKGSTMDNALYNEAATGQLSSHEITKKALKESLTRVLKFNSGNKIQKPLRIADLGSAGGVNAVQLLRYVEGILHENGEHLRPIEYFFEELPTRDFNELIKTIHGSNLSDQFYPMVIGKSFYDKLFPASSVDLFLSYITLHWMKDIPDIQRCGPSELEFFQPNEPEVSPHIFEKFRSASINDMTIFLQLRAEELADNGEGLFLMVGGGSLGFDNLKIDDKYGGLHMGFIHRKEGNIFKEAFENAAKDIENVEIAKDIQQAHLATFAYYFMRCESDVLESFEHVKDVLELKELQWKSCPVTCGSSEKLGDFLWSIHANSITECTKNMVEKDNAIDSKDKIDISNAIINAVKRHLYILTEKDFPEGNYMGNYMYMVVKRKARK